ncbi:MAG: phosphatidate cytidylyltransferase [Chlorobi bacterium]|nr:phosphatidate cytidylyltransferase [Chlorobiota bacterium]
MITPQQSGKFRDLLPRIAYAIAGITIVIASFLHPISAHLLFLIIAIGIWFETLSLLIPDSKRRYSLFLIGSIPLLLTTADAIGTLTVDVKSIVGLITITFIAMWLLSAQHREKTLIALLVFVVLNSALLNWFAISISQWSPKPWIFWLVLVWINDTFAYFTGRLFGKHKIAPEISPGKTIEGLIGGFFFTMLAAAIYALVSPIPHMSNPTDYIISATIVSVAGPAGDLFESAIKRYVGVKDSGKLLGPHGGLFDRMDAWLFVAACVNLF